MDDIVISYDRRGDVTAIEADRCRVHYQAVRQGEWEAVLTLTLPDGRRVAFGVATVNGETACRYIGDATTEGE